MAKVPKHRKIKRATVLIKRTRCIKNTKKKIIKTPSLLYQKLKINNHSLAKALSQERQEYRLLFSRNNELLAEVQDLVHACNKRDLVISNILKNSKDMMQMLVNMSGFLSNVISSCQAFVSNQVPRRVSSSGSTERRESIRRLSTKSPARGVVKPMVSGHTITKPTINLSRVNMQRLPPISNLSIIDEPASPDRNSSRSTESRRSRSLSERLPVPSLRNEDDEERAMLRRRSNRYSGGRLSSGRYSKRNSGRLSGGSVAGRLSKRSIDSVELLRSPRVSLQDVSRYLTNNQTVNIRLLTENSNCNSSSSSSPDDAQPSESSSPEERRETNHEISQQPEPQGNSESQLTSESETETTPVQELLPRKSMMKSAGSKSCPKRSVRFQNRSSTSYSSDDPLEGPSWMFNDTLMNDNMANDNQDTQKNNQLSEPNHNSSTDIGQSSPVSSLSPERRRSSVNFRVPDLPKRFVKPVAASRLNLSDELDSSVSRHANGLEISHRYSNCNGDTGNHNDENEDINEDDDDDNDRRRNLCFITQRRGTVHDDVDDDETMMLNMRRQVKHQASIDQQQQSPEQDERMQFDLNELLQMTPLKPLLSINCAPTEPVQFEPETEPTVTVQLTQRVPPKLDESITISRMSTEKLRQAIVQNHETATSSSNHQENRSFSELSTSRLSERIELPRLTEFNNTISTGNNQPIHETLTPVKRVKKTVKNRKRTVRKQYNEISDQEEEEEEENEETPKQKKKKSKQRRKNRDDKDPSCAKVVLQKLNDSQQLPSMSEQKNSMSSARSSVASRADHSSDSECSSNNSISRLTSTRPRRQKAPTNLREPRSSVASRSDHSSDSEYSSNNSISRLTSTRPRRQKAPTNLREPSVKKKLRR